MDGLSTMALPAEKLSRRLEDYLEAVLMLSREGGVARVSDIAERTEVSKPTVTAAVKSLSQAGLVNHGRYQFVTLTKAGEEAARQIRGRHEALVEFMVDVLDLDLERAEANACRMEHVVDDVVLDRLSLLAEVVGQYSFEKAEWLERFSAYRKQRGQRGARREQGDEP